MQWRGERVLFPIVGVVGFLGIFSILVFTLMTHEIGRIAGPGWIVIGILGYIAYRRRKGMPIWASIPHDWSTAQLGILKDAGELELMDELTERLKSRSERPFSPE
jgi:basic amino acid/polyamine antiporter, APA family